MFKNSSQKPLVQWPSKSRELHGRSLVFCHLIAIPRYWIICQTLNLVHPYPRRIHSHFSTFCVRMRNGDLANAQCVYNSITFHLPFTRLSVTVTKGLPIRDWTQRQEFQTRFSRKWSAISKNLLHFVNLFTCHKSKRISNFFWYRASFSRGSTLKFLTLRPVACRKTDV